MSLEFISLQSARQWIDRLNDVLSHPSTSVDPECLDIITALHKFFEIAKATNLNNQVFTPEEISDIGEHGLTLMERLMNRLSSQLVQSNAQELQYASLAIAYWTIQHGGVLGQIQLIVDGIAQLANTLHDTKQLTELSQFTEQVVHACSDTIRHDLDTLEPQRPWRILNLNRGIIATRSQDPEIMRSVFNELIQAIPMDAPGFFGQGLSEMDRLNYPEQVRAVMQEFHDRVSTPPTH